MPFELRPDVAAGLALSAAIALVGPVVAAVIWRRRTGAPFAAWAAGALVFFVSQIVLRLPWQIPLGKWVHARSASQPGLMLAFLLLSCLTAGLFEEWGRWVGYRTLLRNRWDVRSAVMFGLGHGGLESILIVGLSLAGLLVAGLLAARGLIPPGPALDAITQQLGALTFAKALLGGVERVSAMALHVGLALIVLQAFTRGGASWVWLAVALHAGANAIGVMSARSLGPAWAELIIGAAAAGVLALGIRLARTQRAPGPAAESGQRARES